MDEMTLMLEVTLIALCSIMSVLLSFCMAVVYEISLDANNTFELWNPIWWYRKKRLNMFGSICVSSMIAITILPWVICCCLYKLVRVMFTRRLKMKTNGKCVKLDNLLK